MHGTHMQLPSCFTFEASGIPLCLDAIRAYLGCGIYLFQAAVQISRTACGFAGNRRRQPITLA
jgi:hypothetical protein